MSAISLFEDYKLIKAKVQYKHKDLRPSTIALYLSTYKRISDFVTKEIPVFASSEITYNDEQVFNPKKLVSSQATHIKTILNAMRGYCALQESLSYRSTHYQAIFRVFECFATSKNNSVVIEFKNLYEISKTESDEKRKQNAGKASLLAAADEEFSLTWEMIVSKREEYKELYGTSKKLNDFNKYLIFCLYTYQPPLRRESYLNILLCNSQQDYQENHFKENIEKNYIDLELGLIYFNKFKNSGAKQMGPQVIRLNATLLAILTLFKQEYKNKYLIEKETNGQRVPVVATDYIAYILNCFQGSVGSVGVDLLRKIYIHQFEKNMDNSQKIELARQMLHTYATHAQDYRTDE